MESRTKLHAPLSCPPRLGFFAREQSAPAPCPTYLTVLTGWREPARRDFFMVYGGALAKGPSVRSKPAYSLSPFFVVGRKHPGRPKRVGDGLTVRRERIDQLKPLQDLGRTEFLLCHFAPADSDWRPQGGYALWRLSGNWPAD